MCSMEHCAGDLGWRCVCAPSRKASESERRRGGPLPFWAIGSDKAYSLNRIHQAVVWRLDVTACSLPRMYWRSSRKAGLV